MNIPNSPTYLNTGLASLVLHGPPTRPMCPEWSSDEADNFSSSQLVRVAELDEELQQESVKLSTHTALDGEAMIESVEVERILAMRRRAGS